VAYEKELPEGANVKAQRGFCIPFEIGKEGSEYHQVRYRGYRKAEE